MRERLALIAIAGMIACYQNIGGPSERNKDFLLEIDSLKKVLPIVSNQMFDFRRMSSENEFDWYKSTEIHKVDDVFFEKHLRQSEVFTNWSDYQSLYYCCFIGCPLSTIPLVVMQRVHNDDESNMFLVLFDSSGTVKNVDIIATITKSPIDYFQVTSEITHSCRVKMKSVYTSTSEDDRSVIEDSVCFEYELSNVGLTNKTMIDSVRTIKLLHE
jgi:hypothetical protein